jgi:hypothetical protein
VQDVVLIARREVSVEAVRGFQNYETFNDSLYAKKQVFVGRLLWYTNWHTLLVPANLDWMIGYAIPITVTVHGGP